MDARVTMTTEVTGVICDLYGQAVTEDAARGLAEQMIGLPVSGVASGKIVDAWVTGNEVGSYKIHGRVKLDEPLHLGFGAMAKFTMGGRDDE